MMQRLQLDQTSNVDPLTLLEKIKSNGISQDVCINDLGVFLAEYSYFLTFLFFQFGFDLILFNAPCT